IESTIMPSYLVRQRQQRLLYCLVLALISLVVIVNYGFFELFLFHNRVTILGSDYLLAWILQFLVMIVAIAYIISKVTRRKLDNWSANHPELDLLLISVSWSIRLILFLFLLMVSYSWSHEYISPYDNRISIWAQRPLGATFVAAPIAFASLLTFYTLLRSFLT